MSEGKRPGAVFYTLLKRWMNDLTFAQIGFHHATTIDVSM